MTSNGACMETARFSVVVADAGPLIHLDELDALDVLSDYAAVFVPNAVWLEVQHHRPQALLRTNVNLVRQLPPILSARINAMAAMYNDWENGCYWCAKRCYEGHAR